MRSVGYCFSLNPVNYRRKWISFLVRLIHHIMDDCECFCILLSWWSLAPATLSPSFTFVFSAFHNTLSNCGDKCSIQENTGLTCAKHRRALDMTLSSVTFGVTRSRGRLGATCSGQSFCGSCWPASRCSREDPESRVHWGSTRFLRHWGMSEKSRLWLP